MLDKAIPIYQKNMIDFSREEKEGYLSVMLNKYPGGLKLLNATSRDILDLCDGSNSIVQIHTVLKIRFPKEKSNTLLRDLRHTLMIMSGENLIKWKDNQNPFLPDQSTFEIRINPQTRVRRATETDFNEIAATVRHAIAPERTADNNDLFAVIASPITRVGFYNDLTLRARMFNFTERIYFLEEHEANKIGMLSILDDFPISRRGIVSLLTLSNKSGILEKIQNLFSGAIGDVKKHISKIKCSLFTDQPDINTYDACLKKAGFIREGVLQSEYSSGIDEWIYGRILDR